MVARRLTRLTGLGTSPMVGEALRLGAHVAGCWQHRAAVSEAAVALSGPPYIAGVELSPKVKFVPSSCLRVPPSAISCRSSARLWHRPRPPRYCAGSRPVAHRRSAGGSSGEHL